MDFDFYTLRVFSKIVEIGSFSGAAKAMGLTQPSVSQQVSKLEVQMAAKLFERVGHEIHLTENGKSFHQFALDILERGESFQENFKQVQASPTGLVRYAMPESCQWTPHFRKIMAQIKNFPEITFEIDISPSEMIIQSLLEGKIDFGFIVGERLNPSIRFEKFAEEHYSAVASDAKLFEALDRRDFKSLRMISYPGWETFFTTWAKAHQLWKFAKGHLSDSTVKIGTLAGAIHAAQAGAGIAILPTHCIKDEIKKNQLKVYSAQSQKSFNDIYIVRRLGESLPKRAQVVLDLLKQAKAET